MKPFFKTLLTILIVIALSPANTLAGEFGVSVAINRYQAPQRGADQEVSGGPLFFYQGERLNVSFGDLSYGLMKSANFQLALEGQVRFEGYDPTQSSALTGMEERDPAFDLGFSIARSGLWGVAQLEILGDITDTHGGYEVTAAYQLPYQTRRWTLLPAIGLSWRSEDLVDYYYGVQPGETRIDRPAYSGHSATNAFIELTVDYKLARQWHLLGGLEFLRLGDNIEASPIIEKKYAASTYSALLYRF